MKGKKTGGRDWKPGESGNPNGRPPLPSEIRKARRLNAAKVTAIITKYLDMTVEDLNAAAINPETPAMDLVIIKILVEAGKTGDATRLNFLLDRTIGKVTDKLNIQLPKPTVIQLADGSAVIAGVTKSDDDDDEEDPWVNQGG